MSKKKKGNEVTDEPEDTVQEGESPPEPPSSPMEGEAPSEPPSPPVEGKAPPEPSEEPSPEDLAAGLPPVDVYALLGSFIGIMGAQAWQWMGLVKDPSTGKIEKDMAQAKVAIDAVAALAAQLEGKVSPSESEQLKAMLSDLRINFVRQS